MVDMVHLHTGVCTDMYMWKGEESDEIFQNSAIKLTENDLEWKRVWVSVEENPGNWLLTFH